MLRCRVRRQSDRFETLPRVELYLQLTKLLIPISHLFGRLSSELFNNSNKSRGLFFKNFKVRNHPGGIPVARLRTVN